MALASNGINSIPCLLDLIISGFVRPECWMEFFFAVVAFCHQFKYSPSGKTPRHTFESLENC